MGNIPTTKEREDMYKSTLTQTIATRYLMSHGDIGALNQEIVNAYQIGKEDGYAEGKRQQATKSYQCKHCDKVVAALYPDGTCKTCWEREGRQSYVAELKAEKARMSEDPRFMSKAQREEIGV